MDDIKEEEKIDKGLSDIITYTEEKEMIEDTTAVTEVKEELQCNETGEERLEHAESITAVVDGTSSEAEARETSYDKQGL